MELQNFAKSRTQPISSSKFTLLLLFVFCYSLSHSQSYTRVDSTTISNGCKIIHIQESTSPLDIHVLEIDLTNSKNKIKAGIANDRVAWINPQGESSVSKETVAHMIERRSSNGETVIGGINADFFNMTNGMQFNVFATGGEILSTGITSKNHAAFYVDAFGEPFIETVNLKQTAIIPGGEEHAINGINIIRYEDYLVLYNNSTGLDKSFANQWGVECLLEPLDSGMINGLRNYKILQKAANVTMTNSSQVILSGIGTSRTFLDRVSAGQIIQIKSDFPGLANKPIVELVGGWGHIVQHGQNYAVESIEEEGTMDHERDRHPRSAAGFNKDKTKMYMVAIDGRSDISIGVNLSQMADFMIQELGVWEALNFDGGGSTVLMTNNKTLNTPSGGVQRAISNALLVVSDDTEPTASSYNYSTQSTTDLESARLYLEADNKNRSSSWVLEVDRSASGMNFSQKWGNDQISWIDAFGLTHRNDATIQEMIDEKSDSLGTDEVLVGAISSSPFNSESGAVYGLSASEGNITTFPERGVVTPALWFNDKNEPFISNVSATVDVVAVNGASMSLNDVNDVRWLDYLVLFNSFIGENTGTNQWGAEVLLEPTEAMYLNGTFSCAVKEKVSSQAQGTGRMKVDAGQLVLSGNSSAFNFIRDNINVGDNIELRSEVLGADNEKIEDIIPGAEILLQNGELYDVDTEEISSSQSSFGNVTRSGIGYNQDKSKIYFFASDQFSENNLGMTKEGFAALMKKYGVVDGLILNDGSNAMAYANSEVLGAWPQNQTAVPNALYVVLNDNVTSSKAVVLSNNIKVYPNPAKNELFIALQDLSDDRQFNMYNAQGAIVLTQSIGTKNISSVNVSDLEPGMYFFKVVGDKQVQSEGKVIITK